MRVGCTDVGPLPHFDGEVPQLVNRMQALTQRVRIDVLAATDAHDGRQRLGADTLHMQVINARIAWSLH